MTYKELIKKIAIIEKFDSNYTTNNLNVEEVFHNDYIINNGNGLKWNDKADDMSVNELIKLENNI